MSEPPSRDPWQQGPYGPPPYGPPPYYGAGPTETSGGAIASMVLGIVALVVYLPWMLLWMFGVLVSPTSY